MDFHQVAWLCRRQFGLLASQAAFRFGNQHPLSGTGADQVGFELGHHREHVEQQTPDRVGRVMDGAADAAFDALDRELVDDALRVPQGTGQSVELGDDESVPVSARGQGFA